MPELPEVETIKRGLISKIKHKRISDVKILWKGVTNVSISKFAESVINSEIINIERRAKILIITLSRDIAILIHLKMTGQLLFKSKLKKANLKNYFKKPAAKHTRLIFFFKDGSALAFNDIRKFGYVKLMALREVFKILSNEKFGPEPLSEDFTIKRFKSILDKYGRKKIKQFLTDQSIISGIGNIYSDEICFYARVLPDKKTEKLSDREIKKLYRGIKNILCEAIRMQGCSIDTYVNTEGRKGGYEKKLKVYGREGEKCLACRNKIKRIKIGGRSSCFCPKCQR